MSLDNKDRGVNLVFLGLKVPLDRQDLKDNLVLQEVLEALELQVH